MILGGKNEKTNCNEMVSAALIAGMTVGLAGCGNGEKDRHNRLQIQGRK